MRDPLRIPAVLDELRATWDALPDVTLPELWALLGARGVALNSTDAEVVEALRALRRRHPFSFSPPLVSDATSPLTAVLAETEGPDRRVTLVPRVRRADAGQQAEQAELWAIVRGARAARAGSGRRGTRRGARKDGWSNTAVRAHILGSGKSGLVDPQPGLWRVAEVKRCHAGEPLVLVDESGVQHRLGVVKRLTVLDAEEDPRPALAVDLAGVHREDLEGRVFVARLADGAGTVVIGQALECFLAQRRELRTSTVRWSEVVSAAEGGELRVRGLDGQVQEFGSIEALLQAE